MPVTARLSRNSYDRFGDEIANELVGWFNKVDEQYRSELREQNELNFARFDARLEQRVAELGAALRLEMASMRGDLRQEIASTRLALGADITAQGEKISRDRDTLVRWMVGLWAAQVSLLIGTVFVVLQGR